MRNTTDPSSSGKKFFQAGRGWAPTPLLIISLINTHSGIKTNLIPLNVLEVDFFLIKRNLVKWTVHLSPFGEQILLGVLEFGNKIDEDIKESMSTSRDVKFIQMFGGILDALLTGGSSGGEEESTNGKMIFVLIVLFSVSVRLHDDFMAVMINGLLDA